MPMVPCLLQKPEKCCCYGRVSRLRTLKHQYLWREIVDVMTSQCPKKTRKGICEFYSSFANQIMFNKPSALESMIWSSDLILQDLKAQKEMTESELRVRVEINLQDVAAVGSLSISIFF